MVGRRSEGVAAAPRRDDEGETGGRPSFFFVFSTAAVAPSALVLFLSLVVAFFSLDAGAPPFFGLDAGEPTTPLLGFDAAAPTVPFFAFDGGGGTT